MAFRINGGSFYPEPLARAYLVSGSVALSVRAQAAQMRYAAAVAAGELALEQPAYSALEGTVLTFAVRRAGGAGGTIAVDWEVSALSEGAPTPPRGTVSWNSGEAGLKQVSIVLGAVTANRSGLITLSNARSLSGGTVPTITGASATLGVLAANQPPQWTPVPDMDDRDAGPLSLDLRAHVTDPEGAPLEFSISPRSPSSAAQIAAAGLALDARTGVLAGDYDGVTPLTIIVNANDEPSVPDADAQYRAFASAPDVFYATNFDVADRAELANLAHSLYYDTWEGRNKVDIERTIKRTGRSALRINLFAAQGANEQGGAWRYSFDGPGKKTANTVKTKFYSQITFYADPIFATFPYTNGSKLWIQYHPSVASFNPGEVVINRRGKNLLDGYRYVTGKGAVTMSLRWLAYSDWQWHSFLDRGAPTVVDRKTLKLRHGLTQYGTTGPDDPDIAHDDTRLQIGGWTTIETYIDSAAGIIKVWVAPTGQPPQLRIGTFAAGVPAPSQDNTFWRGGLLIARTEDADRGAGLWPSEDTFIVYDSLIASHAPIPFPGIPGGYALPYPGEERPPNYPPAGATEWTGH